MKAFLRGQTLACEVNSFYPVHDCRKRKGGRDTRVKSTVGAHSTQYTHVPVGAMAKSGALDNHDYRGYQWCIVHKMSILKSLKLA